MSLRLGWTRSRVRGNTEVTQIGYELPTARPESPAFELKYTTAHAD